MPKTRQIPLGNYPSGSRSFGPWVLPKGLGSFSVSVGRCTAATPLLWPLVETRIRIDMEFSHDGGKNYSEVGAESWEGPGGIVNENGVDIAETVLAWEPVPDGPAHAKVTMTVINGPVLTYVDVMVLP